VPSGRGLSSCFGAPPISAIAATEEGTESFIVQEATGQPLCYLSFEGERIRRGSVQRVVHAQAKMLQPLVRALQFDIAMLSARLRVPAQP
jgi:hypothetical protein